MSCLFSLRAPRGGIRALGCLGGLSGLVVVFTGSSIRFPPQLNSSRCLTNQPSQISPSFESVVTPLLPSMFLTMNEMYLSLTPLIEQSCCSYLIHVS